MHGEHVSAASAVSTGSTVGWDLLESACKHSRSLGAAFSPGSRALRPRATQVTESALQASRTVVLMATAPDGDRVWGRGGSGLTLPIFHKNCAPASTGAQFSRIHAQISFSTRTRWGAFKKGSKKELPGASQEVPGGPPGAPGSPPRGPQEAPRSSQEAPRRPPRGPRRAPSRL